MPFELVLKVSRIKPNRFIVTRKERNYGKAMENDRKEVNERKTKRKTHKERKGIAFIHPQNALA
jgi:hypothetical protein